MITVDQRQVRLGATPASKDEAIRQVGQLLVDSGCIQPGYIQSMFGREAIANTYLGNGIVIPHGKPEDRAMILQTGIAVLQVPAGVTWNSGSEIARLVVGIAARSDEHIDVLRRLTRVLGDAEQVARLSSTADVRDIVEALTGERPAAPAAPAADFAQGFEIVIPNATGLHARPATALVDLARSFRSEIRVRYGAEVADAKSMISLLQLGAGKGAQIRVSAEGPDAPAALDALHAAIAAGLGDEEEPAAPAKPVAGHSWTPAAVAATLVGLPASDGLAVGVIAQHARRELKVVDEPGPPAGEADRLQQALDAANHELSEVYEEVKARLGSARAAIFRAHGELLNDFALIRQVTGMIMTGHGAAWSWREVIAERVAQMQKLDDPVLAGRAVDLSDVGQRVLRHLVGDDAPPPPAPGVPVVLIADDLTPSDTAALDPDSILGFCTAGGGPTAHTAIIARSLGIPAVVGAGKAVLDLPNGTPCILDGFNGKLFLKPGEADVQMARALQQGLREEQAVAYATRLEPAVTSDGYAVEVAANVNRAADAARAVENGADGVGLMRTEFLFLERDSAPDEDEQFAAYKAMVEALAGRPLIIRTLDIGGDKEVPYLGIPREDNSFLGIRGIRLCLARPDLFVPQLRAIYRAAAYGPIKMMFPMIATLEELAQAREQAERVRQELNAPPVEIGIMVEVPSAVLLADHFAKEVDFFSIGTNDLTQYTLAMDRQHPLLARQADALSPAVLRMVERTVQAAEAAGKWVGVCGGIASDPLGAAILVGLGVRELSVSLPSVPGVKAHLRSKAHAELRELAQQALACRTAAEVRAL